MLCVTPPRPGKKVWVVVGGWVGVGGFLVIWSTPTIQQLVFLAKFYFWPKFPQKFPFFLYDLFLCSALLLRERDTSAKYTAVLCVPSGSHPSTT